jgi:ABC-type glycerol-3-phosphate transport system permease component
MNKVNNKNESNAQSNHRNLLDKHWSYAKVYLVVQAISFGVFIGYTKFLGSSALEGAGLAGVPFLVLLGGLTILYYLVTVGGIAFAVGTYIKAKKAGVNKTYWPSLIILIASAWPFLLIFFKNLSLSV